MSRKLELQVKDIWARKGILKISLELLKDLDLKTAGLIFGKLFIIKADNILFSSYTAPAIEYKCVSAGFDIVKEIIFLSIVLLLT